MLKKTVSILMALVLTLMSGCWDARDIEDLDICTAVVVDWQDGEYAFYVEVVDIATNKKSDEGSGQGLKTTVVKGQGESFAEARHDLDKMLNKPVYLGAVQSLIMTDNLVDHGLEEYMYRVREIGEYRKTMDMIVTPDNPEHLLSIQPENSPTIGFSIEDTLQNLLEQGVTFHMSLADVLQKLCAHNKGYLLSTLGIKLEQISLLGYTIFNGGQRIGYIPYEDARGIVFVILGGEKRTPKFLYVVNVGENVYTLETSMKSNVIKAGWDGSRASFTVNTDFEAKLLYQSFASPVTPEVEKQIKTGLSDQLLADVTQAIQTSVGYGCDYLYFSEPFRITYPSVYDQVDWDSTFTNADFAVNINVALKEHEAYDYSR